VKIGILGGSFDPIHQGHVYIALRLIGVFQLDKVWFMVARVPPHKEKKKISASYHRYAMTVLALQEYEQLVASTWELERDAPSFTVNTLSELARTRPADRFCFIAGSDSLRDLHSWKDYGKLLLEHCCVFVQRPSFQVDVAELPLSGTLKEVIQPICSETQYEIQAGRSFLVTLDPPAVSSTAIRDALAAGETPSPQAVSPSVLAYISKYRLYENNRSRPEEGLRDH